MSVIVTRSRMSREGRDTLWLLCVLGLTVLPHAGRLPLWCALATAAALLWRAHVARKDGALPPRWVLVLCLVAGLALTLWTYRTVFGREAGVTLVTLLAGLKTLELRARRDAFVVTSLGFFLILTQFLYSQGFLMAVLMVVALIGLLTSLVLAQRPTGRPPISSAVKAACRSVVMGMPVMLALFILFPRLGPLWSLPADAGQRTGLSEDIELGHVAELALDDSVAMRIRFFGGPPMARNMYFRGPVLDVFDGRRWQSLAHMPVPIGMARRPPPENAELVVPHGRPERYQVTLEPTRIATVPLLEGTLAARPTPPATSPQLRRDGLLWMAGTLLTERAQIDAEYWLSVRHGPEDRGELQPQWLQLPRGYNPRTLAWAAAFKGDNGLLRADGRAISAALLRHIRQGGFNYSLTPGTAGGDPQTGSPHGLHLIDSFWLDHKTGFCEHFATSYVFVMRAMGVPSRVVTGFQGGELNPVDGLYVVRNSDAHAWAEIWLPNEGWVRVDPTAAVAPDRIERARQVFRHRNPMPGPLSNIDPAVWGKLRSYMDAGNHRWNVWVLQYSRSKQMALLKDWGFDSPNWVDLMRLTGVMLIGLSALGIGWLWWSRPRTPRTPWRRPLMRVHRALVACGLTPPPASPAPAAALSWAQVLEQSTGNRRLDEIRLELRDALRQLDALRYAPDAHGQPQMRRERGVLVEHIEALSQAWRAARRRDRAN